MKYALATILDQTHGYYSDEGWQIHHPNVKLFDTKEEIEALIDPLMERENFGALIPNTREDFWIEDVPDETEFRSREDTW